MHFNTFIYTLRQIPRKLNLGIAFYKLYYAPKAFMLRFFQKGAIDTALDFQAQQQMERAALQLTPIEGISTAPLDIYFLSGKRFWYQTCFCAYSIAHHSEIPLRPIIYDDGSLQQKYQESIQTVFPNASIVLQSEIEDQIDQHLPISQFPALRERRLNYPNIRKLTDIHAGSSGWKLVLDSDMLCFKRPDFLLDWLQKPDRPCHMVDTETSYGYPIPMLKRLAGAEIAERLNVGICGLNSSNIDWEKLEYWCRTLIEQQGTHYYQEQALIAMLMADQTCAIAPEQDYIVMPNQEEGMHPRAILHHYVASSKPWYFRYGWKNIY